MHRSERAPWALVLAAGESRRFGSQKLVAPLAGKPLIRWTLNAIAEAHAAQSLTGALVVIRADDEELKRALDPGLPIVFLPRTGVPALADSLRAGIAALSALPGPPVSAALICLADQPALRPDVITTMVMAWRASGAPILRPRYAEAPEQPGHPLLLDRPAWPLVETATGDSGLGPILAERPELLQVVDVPGRNPDIDSVADLERFLASSA